MPLLSPSEKSALELMLRSKLGSGIGTTALLKTLAYVNELYVQPEPPEVTPDVEIPSGEGTPEYDAAPLVFDDQQYNAATPISEVVVTESSP